LEHDAAGAEDHRHEAPEKPPSAERKGRRRNVSGTETGRPPVDRRPPCWYIPVYRFSYIVLPSYAEARDGGSSAMTEHLTKETFTSKVFDYEKNQDWKFEGELPAIVDFWAEWCGPCKMVSPVLEEISREFEGKLNVYKVNVDEEVDLASAFGIQSIPSLLFIPLNEKPRMAAGAMPKAGLVKLVKDVLKVE
jgi:thioredoxin